MSTQDLARLLATIASVALATAAAAQAGTVIRTGGPSRPSEPKVAIVGSDRSLAGKRFAVVGEHGAVVARGRLTRARGNPAPFRHAYAADWSSVSAPGSYRIRAAGTKSGRWAVDESGPSAGIAAILGFFEANRDGTEPSPVHGPAHLNDAVIHPDARAHGGERIAIGGGWMDAGDMIHFTQTTAFAASVLQAAAVLDPADAAALNAESDVGLRWLAQAHPFPDAFVAQVGDERDHDQGFRDPAADDSSRRAGVGQRFAYTLPPGLIGGDLGGKTATAMALAYQRTGSPEQLEAAREWYDAGALSARSAPALRTAGYPRYAANFYHATHWQDSMATGALELYRATGEAGYLDDFATYVANRQSRADGTIGVVDSFAQLGAADACGSLGRPPVPAGPALTRSCSLLRDDGAIAASQAARSAFGMPGFFTWGTTAQNGASGALAALSTMAPRARPGGCAVAAGARDYMLGRNPFGRSFVVGYGRKAPRHPHTWASVFGNGLPVGAVVGGPAPASQVKGQGFHVHGPLQSRFATYEDSKRDYVTSEPALDYAASSILLLAALRAHC